MVFALVELRIDDLDAMEPYIAAVAGTIEMHGGRYLVRGGDCEVQEGRLGEYPLEVIVEFPSKAAADAWYRSAEYPAILPYRKENSAGNFIWLTGV